MIVWRRELILLTGTNGRQCKNSKQYKKSSRGETYTSESSRQALIRDWLRKIREYLNYCDYF